MMKTKAQNSVGCTYRVQAVWSAQQPCVGALSRSRHWSFSAVLAVVCVLALALTGCGRPRSGKEKSDKTRRERPTIERVQEVQVRIAHLQHSLAQLYQENEIQQAKIRNAQENLEALRKSLGELARAGGVESSLATTSPSLAVPPPEIQLQPKRPVAKSGEAYQRAARENRVLSTLLLVAFIAFVVVFGYSYVRPKRKDEAAEGEEAPGSLEKEEHYVMVRPSESGTEAVDSSAAPPSDTPQPPSAS